MRRGNPFFATGVKWQEAGASEKDSPVKLLRDHLDTVHRIPQQEPRIAGPVAFSSAMS